MQDKSTLSSPTALSEPPLDLPQQVMSLNHLSKSTVENFGVQTSQRDQNCDRPVIGQEDTQPTLVYQGDSTSVPPNREDIVILHLVEQDEQDGKQPVRSILDELIRDAIKPRGLVVQK